MEACGRISRIFSVTVNSNPEVEPHTTDHRPHTHTHYRTTTTPQHHTTQHISTQLNTTQLTTTHHNSPQRATQLGIDRKTEGQKDRTTDRQKERKERKKKRNKKRKKRAGTKRMIKRTRKRDRETERKRDREREREREVWRARVAPHSLYQILWCVASLSRCRFQPACRAGTDRCADGTVSEHACSATPTSQRLLYNATACVRCRPKYRSCGVHSAVWRPTCEAQWCSRG